MNSNNRRSFLKKSIMGISGAVMIPAALKGTASPVTPEKPGDLPSRILGKTGIKTPLISFGTSGSLEKGLIKSAYDAGVNVFFTATYYGEGNNEKMLGESLKGLPRDSFVVGTAVPSDALDNRTGTFQRSFDVKAYIEKAEGSLARFGLDYVDFILFPFAGKRETVMNEGVLKALEQLKQQGKTRFVGIASHGDTEEALKAAADATVYDVAMIAYNYKVKGIDALNSAVADAAKAGIGIVAMKTTAGVFRNKTGPQFNSDALLKWALQNENICSIVSGMSSLEHLQKNLAMIRNLKMTDQEIEDLKLAVMGSETGLYCQQCRKCIPQCPYNLDIPAIMRSYMYAYGYKNTQQAFHTLADTGISEKTCEDCGSCNVKCDSGFDIKRKITDISRLRLVPEEFLKA